MPEAFGVLLVRLDGHTVDPRFEYHAEWLPAIGDEIEVVRTSEAPNRGAARVRAKVTGLERAKSLPIRAAEL